MMDLRCVRWDVLLGGVLLGGVLLGGGVGCHDFRNVEADGRCGNGVWEPESGEDCDGPTLGGGVCGAPNDTRACRFVCEDGASCPTGFSCGGDGTCRAPSGHFEQAEVLPMSGARLLVGDFDGDQRTDLASIGNTELTVAYGDRGGAFASRISVPVPPFDANPAIGDVNDDGLIDLALPLQAGPQLFLGQPGRTPLPVAAARPFPAEGEVKIVPTLAEPPYLLHQLLLIADGRLSLVDRALDASEVEAALAGAPTVYGTAVPAARLQEAPGPDTIALAPVGHDRVLLTELTCPPAPDTCHLALRQTLTLPEGATVIGNAYFADFDGTGQIDLIVGGRRGDEPLLMVGHNNLAGGVGDLVVQPGLGTLVVDFNHIFPLARERRLAALAQLDSEPGIDFVTCDGGFVQGKPGEPPFRQKVSTVRPWREAVAADFNGDGHVDIAGIRPGSIDIFVQTDRQSFNPLQAPTPDAQALRVADFDGDLTPDLMVLENTGILAVLFAGLQRVPSERVVMGSFVAPESLVTALLPNHDQRLTDGIADAVLLGQNAEGERALFQLRGTNARRLVAPIAAAGVPNTYQIGHFSPSGRPEVAIKEDVRPMGPPPMPGMPPPPAAAAFRLAPADDVVDGKLIAPAFLPVEGCDPAVHVGFEFGRPIDLDDDGRDEWLLINRHYTQDPVPAGQERDWFPRILRFEEAAIRCQVLPPVRHTFAPTAPPLLVDLDQDGLDDMVVPLGRRPLDTTPEGAAIAVWWGSSTDPFEAPVIVPVNDSKEIALQIEALDVDERAGPELLVSDSRGLTRLLVHPDRTFEEVPPAESVGAMATSLRTLDANGDGLDDLAIGTTNEVVILLQRPCDAREAALGQCIRAEAP